MGSEIPDKEIPGLTSERERNKLVLAISVFSLLPAALWAVILLTFGAYSTSLAAIFALAGSAISLLLARRGQRLFASHVQVVTIVIAVSFAAVFVHDAANVKVMLLVMIVTIFLLFYAEGEKKYALFHSALSVSSWVAVNLHHQFAPTEPEIGFEFASRYMEELIVLSGFGLIAVQAFYFRGLLLKNENSLHQAVADAHTASEAKSNFLANMSHEIRTPMNGVVGMVEVLLKTDVSKQQGEMLETVKESSFSLLRIIDDILDSTRIEAGKPQLKKTPADLEKLLNGIVATLRPIAQSQGLRIRLNISDDFPIVANVDAGRLRQVLVNIFGYAIKFSDRGDDIVAEYVDITASVNDDGRCCFAVRDSGIGMSPEAVVGLFTPFSQYDDTTSRRFGGTGLGF